MYWYFKRLKQVLFFTMCLLFSQFSPASHIDKVVIFGDSLSDTGNIYALSEAAHRMFPLIPLIPKSPPYYSGRFSNGPIWVDEVALRSNLPILNFSYGGAWAEDLLESKVSVPFSLGVQVNYFLMKEALDFYKDRHLYIIWSGANDYIWGRNKPEQSTDKVIRAIRNNIDMLIYYGAKNILVLNLPDLGIVPFVRNQGIEVAKRASQFTELHNRKLKNMLINLRREHPHLNILEIDVRDHFGDMIINPRKYNLKNIVDPCYTGGYFFRDHLAQANMLQLVKEKINIDLANAPQLKVAYQNSQATLMGGGQICPNPSEYLFWDTLHPTSKIHSLTAEYIMEILVQNEVLV